jgi:hypothetical protein
MNDYGIPRAPVRLCQSLRHLVISCGSVLVAFSASATQLTVFHPVTQLRSVDISGELRVFDTETRETESVLYRDERKSSPDDPLSVPMRLGMDINLGTCFGQGIAVQSLTLDLNSIAFEGTADVNMNGYVSQPKVLDGSGSAEVRFAYSFRVDAPQMVRLAMNSTVGDFRDDDFKFALSIGGQVLWAATSVTGDDGIASRDFYRDLMLGPGVYDIQTTLGAGSSILGDYSFAGRTWAEFSISAVPEPQIWMMLAFGGALVLVARPRMHR